MTAQQEFSAPIQFPCDFMIKVMGKANDDFKKAVIAIMQKHFPNFEKSTITTRSSKDNNYLAITITVYAESKQQLDAIYTDLTSAPEVLMAF